MQKLLLALVASTQGMRFPDGIVGPDQKSPGAESSYQYKQKYNYMGPMKLEYGVPVTEPAMHSEMKKFSQTLEPFHYENGVRLLNELRREKGYAGDLPPITTHAEFEKAMTFPNLGIRYRDAQNGLTNLEHMEAYANSDREDPAHVEGFTKEARKVRAELRMHVDEFKDPA